MTLFVQSLASGSSGNCLVLGTDQTVLLIDAGIAASTILAHLEALGGSAARLTAMLLTHEHVDHVRAVGTLSRRLGVPVIASPRTLDAAEALVGPVKRHPLSVGQVIDLGDLVIRSFPVPHDAAEPVGFLVQHRQATVCYATDIGAPAPDLLPVFAGADLLVIEANHDLDRLNQGPYPDTLKARIRGARGHLSNAETAALLTALGRECPRTVWLAHLSAENNTPTLARRTVASALAASGLTDVHLEVLRRDRPGALWRPAGVDRQLPLF